jgi:hypothetical protein
MTWNLTGWFRDSNMKALLLLLVLAGAGYYFYERADAASNPETITNPVYAVIRVDAAAEGRELNMAMFGAMASEEDCRERAMRVWEKVISCSKCTFKKADCSSQLESRYTKLFTDTAIHSTYLSFTRGSRYERDGRMVIYGLSADEGAAVCEPMKAEFKKRYTGRVECVAARRD